MVQWLGPRGDNDPLLDQFRSSPQSSGRLINKFCSWRCLPLPSKDRNLALRIGEATFQLQDNESCCLI